MCCFRQSCNNRCWNRFDHCEEEKRRAYWEGYRDGRDHASCRWYGYDENGVSDDYYGNHDCDCN